VLRARGHFSPRPRHRLLASGLVRPRHFLLALLRHQLARLGGPRLCCRLLLRLQGRGRAPRQAVLAMSPHDRASPSRRRCAYGVGCRECRVPEHHPRGGAPSSGQRPSPLRPLLCVVRHPGTTWSPTPVPSARARLAHTVVRDVRDVRDVRGVRGFRGVCGCLVRAAML
jgi:hypothetical protein